MTKRKAAPKQEEKQDGPIQTPPVRIEDIINFFCQHAVKHPDGKQCYVEYMATPGNTKVSFILTPVPVDHAPEPAGAAGNA